MRKFCTQGPVFPELHYCVPREKLTQEICLQLVGKVQKGAFLSIVGPEKSGKTSLMQQVFYRLRDQEKEFGVSKKFSVIRLSLEYLKNKTTPLEILKSLSYLLIRSLNLSLPPAENEEGFLHLFSKGVPSSPSSLPVILILDEWDALDQNSSQFLVSILKMIHGEKSTSLHSLSLITSEKLTVAKPTLLMNTKSALLTETTLIQIPNFTLKEVEQLFQDYERESGQKISWDQIRQKYRETEGAPKLICDFGEGGLVEAGGFSNSSLNRDLPFYINFTIN